MAQETSKKRRRIPTKTVVRYSSIAAAMCLVLAGGIYASQGFEQFLIRDPRFFLPGPAEYGHQSANIELSGVRYASRARILGLFDEDYGRSIYLLPLAARRKALLNINWVREASLVRVWPDRLDVVVTERQPVAFLRLPSTDITRWALIDDEGFILDPPAHAPFHLPVLSGIPPGEPAAKRAKRVRRMQQLMKDLARHSDGVSEVDVSDLDDLKISWAIQGRAVTLLMGESNFSSRIENFLDHYSDIHRKMPKASTFDLRLDDRITGLEDPGSAR